MALAQDQRAMLQLLLERGQSYDDIASLLGGTEADVRRRARAALEELGGTDPDSEVGLTDYLLGQADPIGRADAVRHLQADPDALALAEEISAKLRLLAPEGDLPDLPQPKKRRRAAAPPGPATPGGDDLAAAGGDRDLAPPRGSRSGRAGLSTRQSRMIAAIGAVAVILLVAVIVIVSGGSEDEPPAGDTTATNESGSTVTDDIANIALEPQGGLDAGGEVSIGLANETQPFADVRLQGLPEISGDEAYVLWFIHEDGTGFPLPDELTVNENGSYDERIAIPLTALGVVSQSRELAISIANRKELSDQIAQAIEDAAKGESTTGTIEFSGEEVLRGEVPRVPAGEDAPAGEEVLPEGGALPEGALP